ncbi:MAG: alcohol dehydrogenase catalytic domain-containing protein [Planctomycetes bacterium]|nr:alcohol dehydrogenase catalytic domain-containing protein [Planctomycetota bacterium]
MHAVTFRSPFEVACVEVTDPVLEAPTDAIVRVELAAICGSDLHVYRGVEAGLDPGTVLGHEFLGTITAVGAAVQRHRRGDRVVSPFSSCCGACWFCQRGLTSRCQDSQLFGWVQDGRGLQGGQAELVRVPHADASLVAVPADVGLEPALLAGDVLATGFHAAAQGEVGAGDVVVVIGLGPIGLCALLGSKERGAGAVFGVDSVPERLELAARFGGVPLDHSAQDVDAAVRAATGGRGADVVIEAVGHADATALAWRLARNGGTLSVPGVHNEPAFALRPGQLYDKNLTYRTGRAPVRALMPELLARLRRGDLDLAALISHRLPLADAAHGYSLFERKLDRCTKVLLVPDQR